MTYFPAQGTGRIGSMLPPQAQAGLRGGLRGVRGLGRYGMIGMLPPQAQAGIGQDSTPTMVVGTGNGSPETTPSGVPEGPMTAWRDGVFGARRQPDPFGEREYPWKDGVFGPSLGQDASGAPSISLASADVVTEVKVALNMLVQSYSVTPGGAYDAATGSAYVTFVEEQTPGYPDKSELYLLQGGIQYPSARGIFVLMQSALLEWQATEGSMEAALQKVAFFYPLLWTFSQAYEAAGFSGSVTLPDGTSGGSGGIQASTVAMAGVAVIGVGVIALMLKKPKRSPNRRRPNRRRRRR